MLIINKPKGITSYDVIRVIKKKTLIKKVGHAGTLDPLASGVLIVGVGREETKKLNQILTWDKEYLTTVRLGAVSETDDAEGPITETNVTVRPKRSDVAKAVAQFIGTIKQVPPQFSAIKRGGKKAYQSARLGKRVNLGWREVSIYSIDIVSYEWPYLTLKVNCSSGTYIRSLARDIGEVLGVGGYVAELTRTKVGDFDIGKAQTLEEFGMKETG